MKFSRIIKWLALIVITIMVVSAFVTFLGNFLNEPNREITFKVEVPSHTPAQDVIVLHIYDDRYPMKQVSNSIHEVEVIFSREFQDKQVVDYAYSRGGMLMLGEEDFYLDRDEDEFHYPRTFTIGQVELIEDKIDKWKWFPQTEDDRPAKIKIDTAVNSTSVTPRDEFRSGVVFPDFWRDYWELQYASTIDHLQSKGYNWIQLAPPWDLTQDNPPVIGNPDFPDDKLRNHIRIFKQAGFKVSLYPQVCCTTYNSSNWDGSTWKTTLEEYKNFVEYHADLSREENVDAFVLAGHPNIGSPDNPHLPTNVNVTEEWLEIWDVARTSNSSIGYHINTWDASFKDDDVLPWPDYPQYFVDQLDFLSFGLSGYLADAPNPSQQEIDAGLDTIFGRYDFAHNSTNLPFILGAVSYGSHNQSTLTNPAEIYYILDSPKNAPYTYNGTLQAMVYEGIMKQIASRDYFNGIFPWGYWYADAPYGLEFSVRGKMAENILSLWFNRLLDSTNIIVIHEQNSNLRFNLDISTIEVNLVYIYKFYRERVAVFFLITAVPPSTNQYHPSICPGSRTATLQSIF